MLAVLLPAVAAVCLAHPPEFDVEVGSRAVPWLPPDLARQVVKHRREFAAGAAEAARWPRSFHHPGGSAGLESAIQTQCERVAAAIRSRAPFAEVVAGLGALAHLAVDLNAPFAAAQVGDAYARSFATYVPTAAPRIPLVFYGQETKAIHGSARGLAPLLGARRSDVGVLESIVREDLDRVGGPTAWRALDDRSSTFGTASLLLNHAASDFANLASWVWFHAGGLVPALPSAKDMILVWKGEPQPRDEPMPHLRFRQAGP
ncbi:MAG TPA: hypothetical protein VLW17_05750 [Thermoanaerobaculaceae bacterium]|nr:hypothetical protein [Thermoanaerobaculaceae bacterium]